MASGNYRVSQPGKVLEEFRELLDTARQRGILAETSRAGRWILEELARTPMEFGESRHNLPELKLHVRVAFVGPLVVRFAVHFDQPFVFILGFQLRAR